jgi:hypothetical protein
VLMSKRRGHYMPSGNCFPTSNYDPVLCNTCSLSQAAYSIGKSFHLTKYSQTSLLLSCFIPVSMISFGIKIRFPSSSTSGNLSLAITYCPNALLRKIHGRHCEFYSLMEILVHLQLPQFFFAIHKVHRSTI